MLDVEVLGAGLADLVRDEVERAVAPFRTENEALRRELERRPAADEIRGMIADLLAGLPKPETIDFKAFTDEITQASEAFARAAAEAAVAAVLPIDGKDGADASDEQVAAAVAKWLEANPPAAGQDGRDGIDGKDGAPGADGKDGADGQPGEKGADGRDGVDGKDGADGIGLASALIDHEGHLIITTTRGAMRGLGRVMGVDGKDGRDGERGPAGLDLRAFDTSLSEDGRILTLSLEDDDLKVTHELQLPVMIYRDVYRAGETYVQGDVVTWAGSLWHCNAETTAKPGEGDKVWTLAAKKGRDGRDAK